MGVSYKFTSDEGLWFLFFFLRTGESYGALWGPETSMILSTERMRKRVIVKQRLHKSSPSILLTTPGSREEQCPGPSPGRPRTLVVQAPGQEGAHMPKRNGRAPNLPEQQTC